MRGHPLKIAQNVILTGLAVVLPIVVTVYLIWFTIDFIRQTVVPIVTFLEQLGIIGFFRRQELLGLLIDMGLYTDVIGFLSEIIAILLFVVVVVTIGAITRYRYGEFLVSTFDYLVASIPGIGTVYQSLRRVGNILMNETTEEFETVKLVELFSNDTYVIAFQTNPSPASVHEATDHDSMLTLFVPMAPNPVTGGFLVYVPSERVIDVDMTVDEAVRTILTSGIAEDEPMGQSPAGIQSPIDDSVLAEWVGPPPESKGDNEAK